MELTRKQAIQRLVMMKSYARGEEYEALEYAISSLKTDEAYQIMYEGGEIFSKADVVDMLEDLKQDFIAEAYGIEIDCSDYVVNVADIDKVIQEKINDLKEGA